MNDKIFNRLAVIMVVVSVLILVGLPGGRQTVSEVSAQIKTRFNSIQVDHDLNVDGALTVAGATTHNGAFTLADTLDVSGAVDFDSTLNVDGGTTLNSTLDVDGNVSSGTGAFTITDSLNVTGAADFDSTLNVDGNVSSATGAFTVADTLQVTGVADFDAGMTFGPTPLYPLGIATASQEIECGTTAVFTGSILITFSTLNTPTYAIASQVTAPITTGAYLYVSDPTTTTITLTSLENDFTAGTTGVQAHYCAIGTE